MSEENNKFSHELEARFNIGRRQLLEEMNAWIEGLSEEERNTPHMSMSGRDFTPLQVLQEIKESTDFSILFVNRYIQHKIESAKTEDD